VLVSVPSQVIWSVWESMYVVQDVGVSKGAGVQPLISS